MVKTRVQTQDLGPTQPASILGERERERLLTGNSEVSRRETVTRKGAFEVARAAYQAEGLAVFFRGLGVCSIRAFVVNAAQFAVYEFMMRTISGAG